jgi:hypothetical protein
MFAPISQFFKLRICCTVRPAASRAISSIFEICAMRSGNFISTLRREPIRGRQARVDRTCGGAPGLVDDVHDISSLQASILQGTQEASPALQVFLLALGNSHVLPESIGSHGNRDQHRDVANLSGPTPLEHNSVKIDVGKFADDLAIAPG